MYFFSPLFIWELPGLIVPFKTHKFGCFVHPAIIVHKLSEFAFLSVEFELILWILEVDIFALLLIRGVIDTKISFLAVVPKMWVVLVSIDVSVFWYKCMLIAKLWRGLLCISIGLLGKTYDSFVKMIFSLFDELEDMTLDDLLIIEGRWFVMEWVLYLSLDVHLIR